MKNVHEIVYTERGARKTVNATDAVLDTVRARLTAKGCTIVAENVIGVASPSHLRPVV